MVRQALDFYFALGFEVIAAADGWVLLQACDTRLVLVHAPTAPSGPGAPAVVRVWPADPRRVRQRLVALRGPIDFDAGGYRVSDPEGNTVVIGVDAATENGAT